MRSRIKIEVDGSLFGIRGHQAHGFALAAGLRPTYNGIWRCWVADTRRLPDLVAHLEHRNIPVEVIDLAQKNALSECISDPVIAVANADSVHSSGDSQLSLFGGVA